MAVAWRSKWLDWKPGGEIISISPEDALTKLTKPASVSFVSAISGETQIISAPDEAPQPHLLAAVELLPREVQAWDDVFLSWTQAHCAFRERSWGGLSSLYISHIEWAHQTGRQTSGDRETFAAVLMSLGFTIQDGLVYGLLLNEDLEAAYWKPTPPQATPASKPRRKWGVQ